MSDPRFKNFQVNLRRTAFGVRFAKLLFTRGNSALTPKMIRAAFKEMGLDIPESVEVTIDVAQLIVAGGAVADAVKAYEGIDDLRSIARTSASTLEIAQRLAGRLGWIDSGSQEAEMMRTATNVALIIASGGLDVKSWMSLALDVTSMEMRNNANAKRLAQQGMIELYRSIVTPQARAASEVIGDYQSGKMSVYGFVAKMAIAAPDLWPQFFPQFGDWAPIYKRWIRSEGSSTTWYGSTSKEIATHSWRSFVAGGGLESARRWVFFYLVEPTLYPFWLANRAYGESKANLFYMAILSTLSNTKFLSVGIDHSQALDQAALTPGDFGDPMISEALSRLSDPFKTQSAAIVESGRRKLVTVDQTKAFDWVNREAIIGLDQVGRIDAIRKSETVRRVLKEKFTYPAIAIDQAQGVWNETTVKQYGRGTAGQIVNHVSGPGAAWRDMRNYFACLAILHELKNDPVFSGFDYADTSNLKGFVHPDTGEVVADPGGRSYEFFADSVEFDRIHRELTFKSTMRKVNSLALGNIGYFLGVSPEKLIRVNRNDETAPAVYDTKG